MNKKQLNKWNRAVVPATDGRRRNHTENLLYEAKRWQAECEQEKRHDFRLLEAVAVLQYDRLDTHPIIGDAGGGTSFKVKCLNCSKEEERFPNKACPRCLGAMRKGVILRKKDESKHDRSHLARMGDAIVRYDCADDGCGLSIKFVYNDR